MTAITAVLAFTALFFVRRAVNPTWINHLVVIREDHADYAAPFQATLQSDGTRAELGWAQEVSVGSGATDGVKSVVVSDVSGTWTDGQLTITDSTGKVLVSAEIRRPWRYCGALVILIDTKGKSHSAWNRLPQEF